MTQKYDLIIIGAGPAGLTAAIYATRSGLKTAIVSRDIGGTANKILLLENWPGFKGSGAQLMKQFYEQLKEYRDVDFILKEVIGINKHGKKFIIKTKNDEFESKALIFATGTERKKLKIKGEEELTGKGVSYCVTCDGFFFKNKTVAVIGGSDCTVVSALALADLAKKVYIIYRGEKLRCEKINLEKLEKKKNVEIIYNAIPKEVLGKEKVEGLKMEIAGKEKDFKVDGVFVEIGAIPIANLGKDLNLKLNEDGEIIVNENMETNVGGVFAAGDIANHKLKQVVVASAQGAIAAKNVYDYVSERK